MTMDANKLIAELKAKYPGKNIVKDPPDSVAPGEIIVELEPTTDHPEKSLALAVVGKSRPHYHKKSTEIYEAVKGELTVRLGDKTVVLKPGQKLTVEPGVVHSAQGDEAWFLTHSTPGWTFEDHIHV